MATANATSPSTGKSAAAKRATARSRPKTSTARASRTTPRASASRSTPTSSSTTGYAERAVLIPVGAALIARERVVSGVNDAISNYTSRSRAQSQLRKFERRGITARNRLEREVRKTRTRVERELRQRRRDSTELASRLQERVLNLV